MNNGHMKESQEDLAVLKDLDEYTFVGFCEFAYTGDYCSRSRERESGIRGDDGLPAGEGVLGPEIPPEWLACPDMPAEQCANEDYSWDSFSRQHDKKKKHKHFTTNKAEGLWSEFQYLTFEDPPISLSDQTRASATKDGALVPGTTTSILYHAKMYVFAKEYLMQSLVTLSLRKLHKELQDFNLTTETSEDILELLEFAYTHTERPESSEDNLRTLVVHYVACEARILKRSSTLRRLLEEYGEMACDLFYKV